MRKNDRLRMENIKNLEPVLFLFSDPTILGLHPDLVKTLREAFFLKNGELFFLKAIDQSFKPCGFFHQPNGGKFKSNETFYNW